MRTALQGCFRHPIVLPLKGAGTMNYEIWYESRKIRCKGRYL
jgi:hypothetical protein